MKSMRLVVIGLVAALAGVTWATNSSASISMTLDTNLLDFRTMNPGESRDLSDKGVYHNQLSLTSTNNKVWYLKTNLVRPFTCGMNTIPAQNFQWIVVSIGNGKGYVTNNRNIPNPFTTFPSLVYTSADSDNTGTQVDIQFRYLLTIPKNQVAGGYDAVARFTMIEQL